MSYKVTCRESCHRNLARYDDKDKYEGRILKYTPTLLTTTKSICCITLSSERGAAGYMLSSAAGEM